MMADQLIVPTDPPIIEKKLIYDLGGVVETNAQHAGDSTGLWYVVQRAGPELQHALQAPILNWFCWWEEYSSGVSIKEEALLALGQ